jgi:hypothetical protein
VAATGEQQAPDVDLGSLDFWGRPAEERDRYFAWLRAEAPISRHEPPEDILGLPEQGRQHYWAIVRYEDVRSISRDPATFCSGQGVQFGDVPQELLEASQSFLAMDAPRHTKLRGLVSAAFTPRQVKRIEDGIRVNARRIIVEAASGRVPAFVDTGLNLVHVDDVAHGHLAALLYAKPGDHYIFGGQNVTLAKFLAEIALMCGGKPPKLRLPRPLVYPFAFAAEAMAHVTSREPFLTVDGLRMSKHRMFFTSAKAERDLGYRARPYCEAITDALDWFRANGQLR